MTPEQIGHARVREAEAIEARRQWEGICAQAMERAGVPAIMNRHNRRAEASRCRRLYRPEKQDG